MKSLISFVLLIVILVACDEHIDSEVDLVEPEVFSFARVQSEIFNPECASCHNSSGNYPILNEDSYNNIVNQISFGSSGELLVVPFEPDSSYLYRKMTGVNINGDIMPQTGRLDDSKLELIRRWIEEGAQNN